MKRKNETTDRYELISEKIHDLYNKSVDEMERRELDNFVSDDNSPDIEALDKDKRIDVDDVLVVGIHLGVSRIHHLLHEDELEGMEIRVGKMLKGELEVRDVAPDGVPEDIIEALEALVKLNKKGKK